MKKYQPKTARYQNLLAACRAELVTLGYGAAAVNLNGAGEFLAWLEERGRRAIVEVKRMDMEAFVEHLQTRPNGRGGALSAATIGVYLYGCKLLLDYAERHGLRGGNPLAGMELPSLAGKRSGPRYVASRAEVGRLYAAATAADDGRLTALLHLLYACGLRRTEVERLDVGDVDYGRALLFVRQGKGRKRRVVPLPEAVAAALREYQRTQRWRWVAEAVPCRAFLLNDRGSRLRGLSLAVYLKKLVKRAGVDERITPHGLRHAVATHLVAGGMRLERIRDFLGHDHLETTQIYTHVTKLRL